MKALPVKDVRNNFAAILNRVAHLGEPVVITKFGKPHAKIVPITDEAHSLDELSEARQVFFKSSAGVFNDHPEMKNPAHYVKSIRSSRENFDR